jgi:hypothetical protein
MRTIADPALLEALITRLVSVRPDAPRRWGLMTAPEMLCHLGDATASVLAHPGGTRLPNRRVRRWIGLYSDLPWPRGIPTLRQVDAKRDGTKPGDFEQDRRRAIEGLRAVAAAGPEALPSSHFIFGLMTQRDWMRWAYKHTEHHLRQFGA